MNSGDYNMWQRGDIIDLMERDEDWDVIGILTMKKLNKPTDVNLTTRITEEDYQRILKIHRKIGIPINKSAYIRLGALILTELIEKNMEE